MEFWRVFWIAVWNGLIEIFPVSAFGHLEYLKELMSDYSDGFKMIVRFSCLGIATAIIVFYRKEINRLLKERKKIFRFALVSLPSVVIFCLLEGKFPSFFYWFYVIAGIMLVTSLLSIHSAKMIKLAKKRGSQSEGLNAPRALLTGTLASLSALPGFSRIAIVMIVSRIYGEKRKEAIELALISGVPILIAMFVKCLCYGGIDFLTANYRWAALAVIVAFLISSLALRAVVTIAKKKSLLRVFGWYQLVVSLLVLSFELIK